MRLEVGESERFDFDEAMLPEDSWKLSFGSDEFEVEKIMNVRSGRKTRYGRIHREFLIWWKGYSDPSLIDEMDLNCWALLQTLERDQANRNRFDVMQSHEEESGG